MRMQYKFIEGSSIVGHKKDIVAILDKYMDEKWEVRHMISFGTTVYAMLRKTNEA